MLRHALLMMAPALRPLAAGLLTGSFALATGCAPILGIDDTQSGPFACVGSVAPLVGDGTMIEIPATVFDIASGEPVEGLRVTRCRTRLDFNCDTAAPYFTDAEGKVSVPVTSGFSGYLKIEDPNGSVNPTDRVTYFWYFSQPIVATRATAFPILSMTREFRANYLYNPGASINPSATRGEIAINASDCADVNAPDVHFVLTTAASSTSETYPFYFAEGLLAIPLVPEDEFTDASGIGGFIGVTPGQVGVRAEGADGTVYAEDTLLVKEDALTTVRLLPE